MTVATDPIQFAALVSMIQEKEALYHAAMTNHSETYKELKKAETELIEAQTAIDRAVEALRVSKVYGTPWHQVTINNIKKAEYTRVVADYEKERKVKELASQPLDQQANWQGQWGNLQGGT